jgi:phage-related protein
MMGLVADKLNAMHGGAIKTADGAKLLGRNFALLNPIMSQGSKGMAELRKQAEAYGVTMGGNTRANMMKLREATENLKLAQIGLSVQFTEHVAPALIKVVEGAIKLATALGHGLGPAFKAIVGVVKDVAHWLEQHKVVLAAVVGAISGVVVALTAMKLAEIAVWLANPFVLLVTAIGAAVAAFIYAYDHVKVFRDIVSTAFNVVKGIVLAVGKVIVAFGTIAVHIFGPVVTGAVRILVSIVKNGFNVVKGIVMVVAGLLTLNFSEAWNGVKRIFGAGFTMIGDVLSNIVNVIVKVGKTILSVLLAPFQLAWDGIKTVIGYIVTGITQLPSTLASVGEHMWDWMLNALKNVVNAIISVINTVVIGGINAMINGINSVTGSIPLVGGSLHIGTLAPISPLGGGGSSTSGASTITPLPNTPITSHGLTGGKTHTVGTGFAKGDVVIKVSGRELARIQKRELWKAMAAGA